MLERKVTSGKEEMDDAMTIHCLRGRLLAERTATKLAKHEAQLMESKLIELETQLCEETKIKNELEKKLTFLLNKLHSLKINSETSVTNSESNAQSCSFEILLDMKSEGIFDRDDHFNQRTSEHSADNSIAVPLVLQTSSYSSEKIGEDQRMSNYNQSVCEALNVLKNATREIERSMERRRLVKSRWTQLMLS